MAWLSAFKGLKKVGVPPVLIVIGLAAVFLYTRTRDDSTATEAVA